MQSTQQTPHSPLFPMNSCTSAKNIVPLEIEKHHYYMKKTKQQKTYAQATAHKSISTPSQPKQEKAWMKVMKYAIPGIMTLVLLAVLGHMLFTQEWEMLYRSQELSLFLPTQQFYEGMQIYPGGTLQWLACWATQFFYHPETGITLLMACWGLIALLLQRIFKLKGWSILLTWVPILLLMATVVQTGYWVYYTKMQGYFFVPSIGILLSLVAACIYRLINACETAVGTLSWVRRGVALVWMLLFAWYGYQWMGAWMFLGLAIMALPKTLKGIPAQKTGLAVSKVLVPALVAALCVIIVPRQAYEHVYCQTQVDTLYVACMPSFKFGVTENMGMHETYVMLFLSFIPMLFVRYKTPVRLQGKLQTVVAGLTILALIAFGGLQVKNKWYRDYDFQQELVMSRCIDESNWEGVLDAAPSWAESDTLKAPTRAMVMMKNLALFRMGRAGNDMFNYLEGCHEARMDSLQIRLTQVAGKQLYYNYGKLNFCYRWCMEDGVEFGWKVEFIKLMAKSALLKSEWKVAEKYLNILKQTRYHREWAEKYEAFMYHPELMAEDPTLAPICKLKEYGDRLDGDNSLVELYLLRTFANGHGVDPVYQEATLLCSLIMKEIDLFWPRFKEYCNMHAKEENFHMPRHYQEAALLYSVLEPNRPSIMIPGKTNAEAMQSFPIDDSVKKSYKDFMAFNGRADIAPLSEPEKRKVFQPMFGNTFYFFYFLVRGQTTN